MTETVLTTKPNESLVERWLAWLRLHRAQLCNLDADLPEDFEDQVRAITRKLQDRVGFPKSPAEAARLKARLRALRRKTQDKTDKAGLGVLLEACVQVISFAACHTADDARAKIGLVFDDWHGGYYDHACLKTLLPFIGNAKPCTEAKEQGRLHARA